MTDAQMLEALVRKAVEGGWKFTYQSDQAIGFLVLHDDLAPEVLCWNEATPTFKDRWDVMNLIFNHEFSRALFGEEKVEWLGKFSWYSLYEQDGYTFKDAQELINSWVYAGGGPKPTVSELENIPEDGVVVTAGVVNKLMETTNKGFKFHLQQAVISPNPIKYMYEVVFDGK